MVTEVEDRDLGRFYLFEALEKARVLAKKNRIVKSHYLWPYLMLPYTRRL